MGDAGGAYRARLRIHATHRGSGCNPAGYRSKFPLECSSTSVVLRPHASCATYLRYCTNATWISFRRQTGGSNQSLVLFGGLLNLWCPRGGPANSTDSTYVPAGGQRITKNGRNSRGRRVTAGRSFPNHGTRRRGNYVKIA